MKKFLAISGAVLTLALVGAGCSSASKTSDTAATAGSSSAVASALTNAGVTFTAKDKTAAAQQSLGADGALISSFTEYKFEGSNMILMVGEVKDPNNVPMVGDELSALVKAQAAADPAFQYSSVGGLNDPHWVAYVLEKDGDAAMRMKVLGAISK